MTAQGARHQQRVRRFEQAVRADLTQRRWLRLHSLLLGALCLLATWGVSANLWAAGVDRLLLRWPLALLAGYAVFIGLLWLWCRWLLSRGEADANLDVGLEIAPDAPALGPGSTESLPLHAGGGGDFAGGGASGSWPAEGLGDAAGDGAGRATGAALEAAGAADEGIVVIVPLVALIGIALLIGSALGVAVFGLFGVEVLLGVAVEIAIASAGGALAYRARREGWLAHALARTWRPMLLLLLMVGVLGVAIDTWLPHAVSLPQALRLLRA